MPRKLDFSSVYDIEPSYLHSNILNFKNSLKENGLKNQDDLDIQKLKSIFFDKIKKEIEFFQSIEDQAVTDAIDRFTAGGETAPFSDRKSYLQYLNDYKKIMEENGGPSSVLMKFKKKIISMDPFLKAVRSSISDLKNKITSEHPEFAEYSSKKKSKKNSKKGSKKDSKKDSEEELIKPLVSDFATDKQVEEANKLVKKEIAKRKEKKENEMKDFLDGLAELIYSIVKISANIMNPTADDQKTYGSIDGRIKTNAEKLKELFSKWGLVVKETKNFSVEKSIEKIRKNIAQEDPEKLIAKLSGQNMYDYVYFLIEDSQLQTILGDLFEYSLLKDFYDLSIEKGQYFFPVKDIKLVGEIPEIKNWYTMDLQVSKTKMNEQDVFIGVSAKLKKENKLSLGQQNLSSYWNIIKSWLDKKELNKYEYVRKNIIWFSSGESDSFIKDSLLKINLLEREIFSIVLLMRMTTGIYEKIDEQKRRMMDSKADELYYTAYLFGEDKIYSFSDILSEIVNSATKNFLIKEKESSWKKKEATFTKANIKNLYQKKKEFWKNLEKRSQKLTYESLASSPEVSSIIKELNETMGEHTYTGVTPEITLK